ncbi:hypothetical protein VNO78_24977 [Psophocarpus tetragonolobus]|uniref:Uncharacterized protein n=1 Tax=Psophocarpus tetragonolobus TaxID=3891 RepID=A0AAN9S699_PSOTE
MTMPDDSNSHCCSCLRKSSLSFLFFATVASTVFEIADEKIWVDSSCLCNATRHATCGSEGGFQPWLAKVVKHLDILSSVTTKASHLTPITAKKSATETQQEIGLYWKRLVETFLLEMKVKRSGEKYLPM